jgi:hypothetical protein
VGQGLQDRQVRFTVGVYYAPRCPDNVAHTHALAEIIDVCQGSGRDVEAAAHGVTCAST